jgi:hypothetical protein
MKRTPVSAGGKQRDAASGNLSAEEARAIIDKQQWVWVLPVTAAISLKKHRDGDTGNGACGYPRTAGSRRGRSAGRSAPSCAVRCRGGFGYALAVLSA